MEAKQFAELLKSPLLVEQLPVDALRDLVSRYPFSPSLQMLLVKHHQLNEHPAYDEQLAKTAIYAPDRRALYRLVQMKPIAVETRSPYERPEVIAELPKQEEAPVAESLVEEAAVEEPTIIAPETNTWHLPIEPGVVPYDEAIDDEIKEVTPQEDVATPYEPYQPSQPIADIAEDSTPKSERPKLELVDIAPVPFFDILQFITHNEAVEAAQSTLDEPPVTVKPEEIPGEEEHVIAEVEQVPAAEEVFTETEPESPVAEQPGAIVAGVEEVIIETPVAVIEDAEPVLEEVAPTQPEVEAEPEFFAQVQEEQVVRPQPATNSKDSFNGWLQRIKRHDILPVEGQLATNAILSPSTNAQDKLAEVRNSQPVTDAVDDKAELDALLEAGSYEASLIKDSIDMPFKPFTDPTAKHTKEELMDADSDANRRMDEQAKKSLSMGEELVTETLAKIYEIQKKTAKAIEAYEILKQRHPHKADEYERKIQKLREI